MTVCIAAIANNTRAIVAVHDTKISNDSFSHEFGAMKTRSLRNRWTVMYSGSPTSYERLQRRINSTLLGQDTPKDVDSVISAIEAAYDSELTHHIDREILPAVHLTREQFDSGIGARRLTAKVFEDTVRRMDDAAASRRTDPNRTELIAFGFDGFGEPHLVSVDGAGSASEDYGLGFSIIGSGEPIARAYLGARKNFHLAPRLGEVCYHMHAAKFAAEDSPPVGREQTITTVFHFDGRISVNYGAAESRAHYNAEMARALPDDTIKAIEASLSGGWVHPATSI